MDPEIAPSTMTSRIRSRQVRPVMKPVGRRQPLERHGLRWKPSKVRTATEMLDRLPQQRAEVRRGLEVQRHDACYSERRPMMTNVLWTIQGLLALLFLFTGGMKLMLPIEVLTAQLPLPGWFVRFIGVAELLGALGLILPGLLRIRPGLTPLAAAGLVIIMIGATASGVRP